MASPETRPGNLPAETTSFVGRREELAEIGRCLSRARLVTLQGPGGVGKTRLALRAATDLRRRFPDGVWLVELSALCAPELLARTVAETLRLPGLTAGDAVDLLADHLADRRLLLVLDTCEHLVHACAMLVETLLAAAPGLRVLATSRESLGIAGEHTVFVAPLEVPRPGDPAAASCDAVALFADRATACRPGFTIARDNRAAVGQLCRRLEGIPLALELAAVRLRAMPVEEIVEHLDDRFRLLGPARTGERRHQTLRTAIAWSHDLCLPPERMLWARLSVFPGDFDLAAAERICTDAHLPVEELLEVLTMLVDKSIVRFDRDGPRYRMLDTLREYGAELLDRSGEHDLLRRRHRDHYTALAEQARKERLGDRQLHWIGRLRDEAGNLRAALEWSLATPGQERDGQRLAVLLCDHWFITSRYGEGREWHRRALAAVPPDAPGRGMAVYGAGMFAVLQGDIDAAAPLLAEALRIAEATGDPALRAHALQEQGRACFAAGDLDGALDLYQEAQDLYDAVGHPNAPAMMIYTDLASVHMLRDDLTAAIAVAEQGMRLCAATGERWCWGSASWVRGAAHWRAGATGEAVAAVREILPVAAAFDDQAGMAMCLDLLMVCAVSAGRHERAATLAGAAGVLWERVGAPLHRGPHYAAIRDHEVRAARRQLGSGRMAELLARGARFTAGEAVAFGLDDRDGG
ncbi:ATP-binding protein [Actinomadura hibisca]|uniref:ATP-binding protein n=1 Tax=Actinomadura hibisca TaxID=68565 RepID=UPI00082BDEAB|nr:tetratricopeptide repeat protein [Actinomadura hibisca]